MQYDPIKKRLGNFFNRSPWLRKIFYRLLDLLLLRAWHVHKELRVFSSEFRDKKISVLDAGAGYGQYSYWIWRKFRSCSIFAVDVKEEQVADCNSFFSAIGAKNIRFEIADLTKFVQPDTYDLVLSIDVMEHILEDVQVFKNFVASMRKGGMLIITTPSDLGGSDVSEDSQNSFIEEHVRNGYNKSEIETKLYQAGFTKVDARYTYGVPGNISWRLSMKYPLTFLNKVPHIISFPLIIIYYVVAYPVSVVMNYFDVNMTHKAGTGLLVKAWK